MLDPEKLQFCCLGLRAWDIQGFGSVGGLESFFGLSRFLLQFLFGATRRPMPEALQKMTKTTGNLGEDPFGDRRQPRKVRWVDETNSIPRSRYR